MDTTAASNSTAETSMCIELYWFAALGFEVIAPVEP